MAQQHLSRLENTVLPWRYLGLYGVSLGFVGWSLSLANVVVYSVACLILLILYWATHSQDWLYGVMGRAPQILSIVLLLSLCVTALVAFPDLMGVVVLPVISTLLVWQEMSYGYVPKPLRLSALVFIGALSLALGEMIDLHYFPSPLY